MKKLGIWLSMLALTLALLPGAVSVEALAAETEEILIPVTVLADGMEPNRNVTYTVELIPETDGCPMPKGSGSVYRLRLSSGSSGLIRLPCEQVGVFDYTIRQIPGQDPDCTYDDRSYRLRLIVTAAEDGGISVSAVVYGQDGDKAPAVQFRNHWADPISVVFSAWKTLDGWTPEDGAFLFRLLAEDGETVSEAKNLGRRVTFPALCFDKEGTYRYEMKEVARTDDDIIYDRAVYTITVKVTKDTDYHAEVTYRRNGKLYAGTPYFANYTDGGVPKTGDSIGSFAVTLGISGAALIGLLLRKRRT